MEDSLPHAAPVLYVPAVLSVEVGVGLRGVALSQPRQDLRTCEAEGGGILQFPASDIHILSYVKCE